MLLSSKNSKRINTLKYLSIKTSFIYQNVLYCGKSSMNIINYYNEDFAKLYDQQGWADFSFWVFKKFKKLIENKNRLLDAACGTGSFAYLIHKYVKKVDAYDCSSAMLNIAKIKTPKINFFQADLISYYKKNTYDVITCFYDSINHLTTKSQWQMALRNFYRSLRPRGLSIFDINTLNGLRSWGKINEKRGNLFIRGFYKNRQGCLMVFKHNKKILEVCEITFPASIVKSMLRVAGFTKIKTLWYGNKRRRVFFIAYKSR